MTHHPRVAYFCMEFALWDDLPIYAGGLGVLAGDLLRAAGDDEFPLVGIGLLWDEGYTRQSVGSEGWPQDRWEPTSRDRLERLDVEFSVEIRGAEVPLVAHRLEDPSHATLYLLEPRDESDRWITRRLYQGGYDDRVAQELVLGVGGVRMLRALGLDVEVLHLNEGHAVFAVLELAREHLERGGSVADALAAARRQVVFTTHTPVPAGNEAHDLELLMEQGVGLGTYTKEQLADIAGDPFNMTEAGLRLSRAANAVSRLHAGTARDMWAHVTDGAHVDPITNGVHVPTWQDPRLVEPLSTGGETWETHQEIKGELIAEIRERTGVDLALDRLLVGFARRAAPYKRADLLFREQGELSRLLEDRRIQVVYAGKAHPDHAEGKGLIAYVVEMTRRFPQSVVFLEDYDLRLGRMLTRGCDAWLNAPLRPREACGTSGMKAALNGVLNVSTLDGWWAEACRHGENGWQFGDGYEGHGQTEHDLAALRRLLKDEVLPTYHDDREKWVSMMRASARTGMERYAASRMLRDYDLLLYRPRG